ncbi:MAG: hypothetical protein IIY16_04610, partial [Oscillospiraceae bacterium]|nr:hypothetical protein [Oscillospiraceae bacterium]
TLVDFNGEPIDDTEIEVDEETVEVTITVVKNKVLPLTIELISGGGMTEEHVAWEFDPPTITVSGDADVLETLNKITVGSVDLATVVADTTIDYPIVLPDGVENETGVVQATLTMKISGLSMTTFRVVDFEFINIPEGYHAEPMTQSLQISVRGPSEEINMITASDLRVVADLSSMIGVAGNYTCDNVAVYLNGYENSGIMGNYSVVVKLITEEDYLTSLAEATESISDDTAEATEGP